MLGMALLAFILAVVPLSQVAPGNPSLRLIAEGRLATASHLSFPSKLLADAAGKRLFISDSSHNRIVVATLPDDAGRATVLRVVGDAVAGLKDGSAEMARFNHPHG